MDLLPAPLGILYLPTCVGFGFSLCFINCFGTK